jgi:hypothetical protein
MTSVLLATWEYALENHYALAMSLLFMTMTDAMICSPTAAGMKSSAA